MKTADMGKAAATVKQGFYPQVPGMMPMGGMPGIPGMGMNMGGFPGYGAPMRPPMGGPGMGGSFGPMGGMGMYGGATDMNSLAAEYHAQVNNIKAQAAMYGWPPAQIDQQMNALNTHYERRRQNMVAIGQNHGNKPSVVGAPQFGPSSPAPVPQFGGGWGHSPMPFSPFGGGFSGPSTQASSAAKYDEQLRQLTEQIANEQTRQNEFKKQNTPAATISDSDLAEAYKHLVESAGNVSNHEANDVTVPHWQSGSNVRVRFANRPWLWWSGSNRPGGASESWHDYERAKDNYLNLLKSRDQYRQTQSAAPAVNSLSSLQARHAALQAEADAQRKEELAAAKAERERQQRYQDWMLQQQMSQGRQQQQFSSPPAGSPNAHQQPGYQMPPNIQSQPPAAPPQQQPRAAAPPQQPPAAPPANAQAMNLPKPPPPSPGAAPSTPPGSGLKLAAMPPSWLMATPLVGGAVGAGVGGVTAPQDYAPEGAARGLHTGLMAGGGAALGGLAGHAAGTGVDTLNKALYGRRGMMLNKGSLTGVGALLGALAGTLTSHKRLDYKPWERGDRPILERADEAMQIRRPAPMFGKAGSDKEAGLGDSLVAGGERLGLVGADPITGGLMGYGSNDTGGGAMRGLGRGIGAAIGGQIGGAAGGGIVERINTVGGGLSPHHPDAVYTKAIGRNTGRVLGALAALNAVRQVQDPYRKKEAGLMAGAERIGMIGADPLSGAIMDENPLSGALRGAGRMAGGIAGQGVGLAAGAAAKSPALAALLGLLGGVGGINAVRQVQDPYSRMEKYKNKQASSSDNDDEKARRADATLSGASNGGMIGSSAGTGLGALAALAANALVNRRAGLPLLAAGRRHALTGAGLGAAAGLVGGATIGGVNGYSKAASLMSAAERVGLMGADPYTGSIMDDDQEAGAMRGLGRMAGGAAGAVTGGLGGAIIGAGTTPSIPGARDPFIQNMRLNRHAAAASGRASVGAHLGGVLGLLAGINTVRQVQDPYHKTKHAGDMLHKVPNGMVDASKRKKKPVEDKSLDGLDALMADLSRKPVVSKRRSFQGAPIGA